MTEKKNFFSFFKGIRSSYDETIDEETKQREYALKQEIDLHLDSLASQFSGEKEEDTVTSEMLDFAKDKLAEILSLAGFKSEVRIDKNSDNVSFLNIYGDYEEMSLIIGKEGNNLTAFQTLLNAILFKRFLNPVHILIDAGDFRGKRIELVKEKAQKAAAIVLKNKGKYEFNPMSATERRIIHMIFKNHQEINSFSVGEGNMRRVIIEYMPGKFETKK